MLSKKTSYKQKRNPLQETSVIILTRNEIKGVETTIPLLDTNSYKECIAVDYQSTDGTVEFFKKYHITVIHQKTPGRGQAFQLGVQAAKGKYIVFFSPDGNEDPRDIPLLVEQLEKGADLSIASRFMKGARNEEDDQIIKLRAWANQMFTLIINIVWNGNVTDSINGYRAMRKEVFKKLHLTASGFAIEYQMTIRALKLGLAVKEIPTKEGNRIGGFSRSYAIPTGIAFLKLLFNEIRIGKQFSS